MKIELRSYTPCPEVHQGGRACEREDDGHRTHWFTAWDFDFDSEEWYPANPVIWTT